MGEVKQQARIVDLTAYKLERMLHENSHDEFLHQSLLDILADYYLGLIAIGWEHGQPVVIPASNPNTWERGIPPGFEFVDGELRWDKDRDRDRDDT
jgi:hypothetical protein